MEKCKVILIVEDDHDIRVTLRSCLEDEGYYVISATNGLAALNQLQSMTAPSLIITDIYMPLMDGDQFISAIKTDPRLSSIPIIQISAVSTPKREGTYCLMAKPLQLEKLIEQINDYFFPVKSA